MCVCCRHGRIFQLPDNNTHRHSTDASLAFSNGTLKQMRARDCNFDRNLDRTLTFCSLLSRKSGKLALRSASEKSTSLLMCCYLDTCNTSPSGQHWRQVTMLFFFRCYNLSVRNNTCARPNTWNTRVLVSQVPGGHISQLTASFFTRRVPIDSALVLRLGQ
jgi:hypothetical protein